jgi:hypothetical protein
MTFAIKPGNVVETNFAGANSAWIPSAAPEAIIARALIFDLSADYKKTINSVTYSLARLPFMAGGVYNNASPWENEVWGRLTIFRNFRQDLSNLFDPYFDINYTNALPPPNTFDHYGPRVDYATEDKVFDLLITKVENKVINLDKLQGDKTQRLTVVLTPFYEALQTGDATPRVFGAYFGDSFARTLSVVGCYDY